MQNLCMPMYISNQASKVITLHALPRFIDCYGSREVAHWAKASVLILSLIFLGTSLL